MNSRNKGVRGERDAAEALRTLFIDARRSQQYSGVTGEADLLTDIALHWEVKFTERLKPYPFIDQAVRDARARARPPLVLMRSLRREWLVLVRLEDLAKISEVIHERQIRARDQRETV